MSRSQSTWSHIKVWSFVDTQEDKNQGENLDHGQDVACSDDLAARNLVVSHEHLVAIVTPIPDKVVNCWIEAIASDSHYQEDACGPDIISTGLFQASSCKSEASKSQEEC